MEANRQPVDRHSSDVHPRSVAFLLAQVGAFASAQFSSRVAELGLSAPEAGLLRSVGLRPGGSQQQISDELGVHPSRLVGFVDDLEQRGLLERRRDSADRRRHAVHLTADGREMLEKLSVLARAHDDAIALGLSAEERALLRGLLVRLVDAHGLHAGVHPGYRSL
jgi:DNA-binding MarR family transcriptional regulator